MDFELEQIRTILFFSVVSIGVSCIGNAVAQTQDTRSTYTSEQCKVSFQYPSNWIVKTKQGIFDTNTTYLIALYNPSVNLTDVFPAFGIQACLDVDVLNMMIKVIKSYPIYGEKLPIDNITDVKSLGLIGEAMTAYTSNLIGQVSGMIEAFGNTTRDMPQITIVEHTTVKPKLISGEDAAVFTYLLKASLANSTSLNIGSRQYAVIHNGITYPFTFADDAAKFDLPENTKIRQRIIESIHFTNDIAH